jgi:hypothetical protein
MSESPVGDKRIGWGGRGQLVPGCRTVVFVTEPPRYTYRIGWGGGGGNWCPGITASSRLYSVTASSRLYSVTASSRLYNHSHTRIGESVAVRSARVSRNRLGHTDPVSLGSIDTVPRYT